MRAGFGTSTGHELEARRCRRGSPRGSAAWVSSQARCSARLAKVSEVLGMGPSLYHGAAAVSARVFAPAIRVGYDGGRVHREPPRAGDLGQDRLLRPRPVREDHHAPADPRERPPGLARAAHQPLHRGRPHPLLRLPARCSIEQVRGLTLRLQLYTVPGPGLLRRHPQARPERRGRRGVRRGLAAGRRATRTSSRCRTSRRTSPSSASTCATSRSSSSTTSATCPTALPVAELRRELNRLGAPEFETVASRGEGHPAGAARRSPGSW